MASPSRIDHLDGVTAETLRSAGLSAPQNRSQLREVDENEEQPLQSERDQQLIPPLHVGQYQERDAYYEQPDDRARYYERERQFEPRMRNAPRENFFEQRGREFPRDDYYESRRRNAPRENYRVPNMILDVKSRKEFDMFSWGTTTACCEQNVELVDNNLLGCANGESMNVDVLDYVDSGVLTDVDSCVNDVVSYVYNCDNFCDLNSEVEEEMDGMERVALVAEKGKEKEEGGMEESGSKSELKPLPEHLAYVFLGKDSTLPVMISSSLEENQKNRLVLIENVKAHWVKFGSKENIKECEYS
nr:uncharacterized protein LOC107465433 [Ipomoea batatas]